MLNYLGIIFALVALLSWGFGDFFIQRTTRVVGVWKTLFFIGLTGAVLLFPFVRQELFVLDSRSWLLLALLGLVTIFAALFDFSALKQGKIAIVEPILGLELPITVGLSISLGKDQLTLAQLILIAIVFVGILLAITVRHNKLDIRGSVFEKGVILAGVGAVAMAMTNFLVGVSSQQISPLVTIWFTHAFVMIVCLFYFARKGLLKTLLSDFKQNPKLIIVQSVLDNIAWLGFAFSTTLIPISITTTISESYIALAVLLGLVISKEKLRVHQLVGVALAICGVIVLSAFTVN